MLYVKCENTSDLFEKSLGLVEYVIHKCENTSDLFEKKFRFG